MDSLITTNGTYLLDAKTGIVQFLREDKITSLFSSMILFDSKNERIQLMSGNKIKKPGDVELEFIKF